LHEILKRKTYVFKVCNHYWKRKIEVLAWANGKSKAKTVTK